MHPTWLGFQVDWPLFVKNTFQADSKSWMRGEFFNWQERGIDSYKVYTMYASGHLYHNEDLEKANKVGDRLSEMNSEQLYSLVGLLNGKVKERTSSAEELKNKRCRQSKIDEKQRGLIRSFLRKNPWIEEDFYNFRDTVLGE
jgi:hypothetical protein